MLSVVLISCTNTPNTAATPSPELTASSETPELTALPETPTPEATSEPSPLSTEEPLEPAQKTYDGICREFLDYTPAIQVSYPAEDENSLEVVASYMEYYLKTYNFDGIELEKEPHIFLFCEEPLYDIAVGYVSERIVAETWQSDYGEIKHSYSSLGYLSELEKRQAIKIQGLNSQYLYIEYTNSRGVREAVFFIYDEDDDAVYPMPVEPYPAATCDDEWFERVVALMTAYPIRAPYSLAFLEKMRSGVFEPYVMNGFSIYSGSLGDVNGDGISDALVCLAPNGMYNAYPITPGSNPLFILLGQPDGGYKISNIIDSVIGYAERGEMHPVAGNGYIDIEGWSHVSAFTNQLYFYRYQYDYYKNDWILSGFAKHYIHDDEEISYRPTSEPVAPLPHMAGTTLTQRQYAEYDALDFTGFDAVATIDMPSESIYHPLVNTYIIAVNADLYAGYYYGYIYWIQDWEEYDVKPYFLSTIRGAYWPGVELKIDVNEEDYSFTIAGDKWIYTNKIWSGAYFRESEILAHRAGD